MNLACHVRRPRQSMLPPQPSAQTISCRQLKTVMINEAEVVVRLRQFSLLCRDLNFCSSLHPSRINPKRWFASTIHIGLAFNNAAPYVSQNMGLKDTDKTLHAAPNTSIESDTASNFVSHIPVWGSKLVVTLAFSSDVVPIMLQHIYVELFVRASPSQSIQPGRRRKCQVL